MIAPALNGPPTVFVVDDDEAVRISLKLLLKSVGRSVVDYASASAYLAAYQFERPGCLVLDIRMPGMSGLELIDAARALHPTLPVVIATGYAELPPDAPREVPRLAKPFLEDKLLGVVAQAMATASK